MKKNEKKITWYFIKLIISFLICFLILIGILFHFSRQLSTPVGTLMKEKKIVPINTDTISTKTIMVKFNEGTEACITGCFNDDEENAIRKYFSTIEPKDIDESKYELKSIIFKYKKIK